MLKEKKEKEEEKEREGGTPVLSPDNRHLRTVIFERRKKNKVIP